MVSRVNMTLFFRFLFGRRPQTSSGFAFLMYKKAPAPRDRRPSSDNFSNHASSPGRAAATDISFFVLYLNFMYAFIYRLSILYLQNKLKLGDPSHGSFCPKHPTYLVLRSSVEIKDFMFFRLKRMLLRTAARRWLCRSCGQLGASQVKSVKTHFMSYFQFGQCHLPLHVFLYCNSVI